MNPLFSLLIFMSGINLCLLVEHGTFNRYLLFGSIVLCTELLLLNGVNNDTSCSR